MSLHAVSPQDRHFDHVKEVFQALSLPLSCTVILVTGTNGKGSTCAMLESIFFQAGYRVGLYTSPHIHTVLERIRIAQKKVGPDLLVTCFEKIATVQVKKNALLSFFDFFTLAALMIFSQEKLDIAIVEVGLGGRLDATNVLHPHCAIMTTVAVDHTALLGHSREAIGYEKSGIFRSGVPAICGDAHPPDSVIHSFKTSNIPFFVMGKDFGYQAQERHQWLFWTACGRRHTYAHPALRGMHQIANASCALMAILSLSHLLPVSQHDVRLGLVSVTCAGRFQIIPGQPQVILDVAHNCQAILALKQNIHMLPFAKRQFAIIGMMGDKDVHGMLALVTKKFDKWFLCPLPSERALSVFDLKGILNTLGVQDKYIVIGSSVRENVEYAKKEASRDDRIVVFGSFGTVAPLLPIEE